MLEWFNGLDDPFKFIITLSLLTGVLCIGGASIEACDKNDKRVFVQKCIDKGNSPAECKALFDDR